MQDHEIGGISVAAFAAVWGIGSTVAVACTLYKLEKTIENRFKETKAKLDDVETGVGNNKDRLGALLNHFGLPEDPKATPGPSDGQEETPP